jgi:hypothetical protein
MFDNKGKTAYNGAVLRDGGSNPAEKTVLKSKFTARSKFIGSRHLAKPLDRCVQWVATVFRKRLNFK